jgi:hypothetical protein
MAHFAEIDASGTVLRVIVVDDSNAPDEATGAAFCANLLDGNWVQTSYNTRGGAHTGGGKPTRKNYAGPGYTYDSVRDAFIPPRPDPDWTFNENACMWQRSNRPVTNA